MAEIGADELEKAFLGFCVRCGGRGDKELQEEYLEEEEVVGDKEEDAEGDKKKGMKAPKKDLSEVLTRESLTIFKISHNLCFADLGLHGVKRVVENMLDVILRDIIRLKKGQNSQVKRIEDLKLSFQTWMQQFSPSFTVKIVHGLPGRVKLTKKKATEATDNIEVCVILLFVLLLRIRRRRRI